MCQVKAKKLTLSLCYVVGKFATKNQQTESFGEIFVEVANNAFVLYIDYLNVCSRVNFDFLKSIADIITSGYMSEKSDNFVYKTLLSLHIPCGKNLLRNLNTFLSNSAFEYNFLTLKARKDYIDKNFRILNNLKWKFSVHTFKKK